MVDKTKWLWVAYGIALMSVAHGLNDNSNLVIHDATRDDVFTLSAEDFDKNALMNNCKVTTEAGGKVVAVCEGNKTTYALGGVASETKTFSVAGGGSCSSNNYPPNYEPVFASYESINDGFGFGQSTNASFLLNIELDQFVALSDFGTTQTNFRRRIVFVDSPTNYNLFWQALITVSHCPGDFTANAVCSMVVHDSSTLHFSTNPNDDPGFYCILDPNESYYINYVLTPDPYTTGSRCHNISHTECALFYSEAN